MTIAAILRLLVAAWPAQNSPAPALAAPAFSPAQLLEQPLPAEVRLGVALARAARGDFEAGAAAVQELAAAGEAAAITHERLERERARLAALAEARRDLLAKCIADKRKLKVELEGKTIVGVVAAVEGAKVVLADSHGKTQEVALVALDPDELLRRMTELKLETGSAATRAYAALLVGRKNWAKGIEGASDAESVALRGDAKELVAQLATGKVGAALEDLARAPLPTDGPSADATLASIQELLTAHAHEPIVAARRELLRRLAAVAFARRFDWRGIAAAGLKGDVKILPDGSVRITYDFADPAELADFRISKAPHPSWPSFQIKRPKEQWKHEAADGAVVVVGEGCLRHKIAFEAPVQIDGEVVYGEVVEGLSELSSMRFSVCDDERGSLITNYDLMCIDVFDGAARRKRCSDPDGGDQQVDVGTPYVVHLENDGKKAKLKVEGRPDHVLDAAPLTQGGVALYWKSDAPNQLRRLVIQGRVTSEGLAPLRDEFVARELEKMFGK